MEKFDTDLSSLHPILTECRVTKSEMELALIQYANDISSEAHVEVMLIIGLQIISASNFRVGSMLILLSCFVDCFSDQ